MNKTPIAVVGLLLISGCGSTPTTQISAFANSTKAITENVDAVIDEYNNTALDREFTSFAATYKGSHANQLTATELAKIAKPITSEQKKKFAIYKANKALGSYATSLSLLSSAGSRADIDLASANLYGSMISINDQYKTIKETEKDLFNTENMATVSKLIAAIGSVIVEEKRRKAIKGIVVQANPKIAIICDEINSQLKTAGIEDSISTSRAYILSEELQEYWTQADDKSKFNWRKSEVKRLRELQQNMFNSKLLVQKSQKAILAVKGAHDTLAKELEKNRFTSASIAAAIGRLKELDKHYDDFEDLLLSCKKISKNDKGVLSCDDK
ncbi:MAG: hypothetical protein RPU91_13930 [Candidatus Sedimenticola sp. (ex Thyasira tokunagai)]